MDQLTELSYHIELHSIEKIKESFANGVNPNDSYQGKPLIDLLISMYTRSPRFKNCVNVFIENGLNYSDKVLLAVLSDDSDLLEKEIQNSSEIISKKYSLDCAYTPVAQVSLLHIYAEFNHVNCAKVLVKHGADINYKAGVDENGFGGQTPVFHTVNQNQNNSADMMDFLLSQKADLSYIVKGILWGKGYPLGNFHPFCQSRKLFYDGNATSNAQG
jgi:ankyrin repeat protein